MICFDCAMSTPAKEKAAGAAFDALLSAAEAVSTVGMALAGGEDGPVPFETDLLRSANRRFRS